MKKKLLLIIIASILFITGCFSYADMNRVYFSTFEILDKEADSNVSLYAEYFVSDRGDSEQGGIVSRIVLKGKGSSSNEAFTNIQGSATYPIKYDLTRAIGFTEKMARNGIEEDLDFIERDQNITNKLFLFITDADPVEFMNTQMSDEKFLGIWLEDIFIFQEEESRVLSIRSNAYLNERLKGSRISLLPIISISKMPTESRLIVSGAAVMKDNKMVDTVDKEEVPVYKILFLKDKNMKGVFDIIYPDTGAKVALSLLLTRIEERIESIDGELTLIYDLKMYCTIHSVVGKLDLLKKNVRGIVIKEAQEEVNKKCEDFYKKYQDKGIDILDVKLKLNRKYPKMEFEDDIFKSVNIKVNTSITLDGSQNITNTLE
ncbi:Ger(x)C family spore germination protein [Tissierella sp. Yu-01]|uniref:Ger(x)C family spore germination protein n=1 Tax=Tissierella sp. Yu-01 TaxID=3035694 RepID=UPI00240E9146|nr:Ger(x)C family spore germination protein [Tissierella sp. Yu-01]WFA09339.1 Ger(x)C family spore germination protein [Tissierella sp. Yu-01]